MDWDAETPYLTDYRGELGAGKEWNIKVSSTMEEKDTRLVFTGMEKLPEGIDPDWIRIEFTVPREYAGWRVDRFVSNRIVRLSRTKVQRILKKVAGTNLSIGIVTPYSLQRRYAPFG